MQNISKAEEDARHLLRLMAVLGRRHNLRDPFAQMVEAMELTPAQFHSLMWLGLDGELSMGELARRLGITEKTVTGIVDRLEKADLVYRGRNPCDRRVVEVGLTERGRDLWNTFDGQIVERTTLFVGALPEDDRRALIRITESLITRLTEEGNEE